VLHVSVHQYVVSNYNAKGGRKFKKFQSCGSGPSDKVTMHINMVFFWCFF